MRSRINVTEIDTTETSTKVGMQLPFHCAKPSPLIEESLISQSNPFGMANTNSAPKHNVIKVVCLVAIDRDNQILATQRAEDKQLGLLWEFPGGKIDTGESAEEALRREIMEELGIELEALTRLPAVTHVYDFGTIQLIPFLSKVDKRPQLDELNAHAAAQWIALDDCDQLQWAPADLPIIEMLRHTELSK